MKKVPAKLTISRASGSREDENYKPITITVEDAISRNHIIEVHVGLKEFAMAITGCGYNDCEAEVFNNYGNIGRFPIRKTIWVEFDPYSGKYEEREERKHQVAKEAAKPYQKDGWELHTHQIGNQHYARDKMFPVYLVKYVDTEEEVKTHDLVEDYEQSSKRKKKK